MFEGDLAYKTVSSLRRSLRKVTIDDGDLPDPREETELRFEMFKRAEALSVEGDHEASCRVATCLMEGDGVDRDYDKGFKILRRTAKKGNHHAQCILGQKYHRDKSPDFARALKYLDRSAHGGFLEAQFELGSLFLEGAIHKNRTIVMPSDQKAAYWLHSASSRGHRLSTDLLLKLYCERWSHRDGALDWIKSTAALGHILSLLRLYRVYKHGHGETQPDPDSCMLYRTYFVQKVKQNKCFDLNTPKLDFIFDQFGTEDRLELNEHLKNAKPRRSSISSSERSERIFDKNEPISPTGSISPKLKSSKMSIHSWDFTTFPGPEPLKTSQSVPVSSAKLNWNKLKRRFSL